MTENSMPDSSHSKPSGLTGLLQPSMAGRLDQSLSYDLLDLFQRSLDFLGSPTAIEGRWYNNQEVPLDGFTFVRCRFDNCELIVSKGNFQLDHCWIQGGVIRFRNEACNVV
jgi:hypothetical protein